jgi:hypothetical protein
MEDEMLEHLILQGYVEVAGIDPDTGDMLYSFTDLAKTQMPHLERQFEEEFHKNIMFFWEAGALDMNVYEENPKIRLNPLALSDEFMSSLSTERKQALKIILDALRIQ